MTHRLLPAAAVLAAALLISACGGGGGGGDDSASSPEPTASSSPSPAPNTVVISGNAQYDSVPAAGSGRLDYAATTSKPIRGAAVEILDADDSTVLATTRTDDDGGYSASFATGPTSVIVRVKAQLLRSDGPSWNVAVRDNTASGALYVLDSDPTSVGSSALTRDLSAASGWGGSGYTGTRAAAPFAILDAVYTALSYTLTAAPAFDWPALTLNWSVNNRPASGAVSSGAIGTSHYRGTDSSGVHQIYILGAANIDTDEYDDHVIVHEWGHYFQAAASRDDSIGGSHGSDDLLDPRVAFSEGWGNAWSGIALGDPVYSDSYGVGQTQGFTLDVSQPPTGSSVGWFGETTAQYLVYTLNGTYGFTPLYGALHEHIAGYDAATTLFSLKAGIKAALPGAGDAINALFATYRVNGTDEWATGEIYDGGVSDALPVYTTYSALGAAQQRCVTNAADSDGDHNKLGVHAFFRFEAPSARSYTLTLTGGTDPDLAIFRPGFYSEGISAVAGSETLAVSLQTATYVIAVTDYEMSGRVCLNLTIN